MQKKQCALKILAVASLLAGVHSTSFAVDSASFELGTGNKSQLARVAAQWDWDSKWWQSNGTHIGGYWDLSLAEFRQDQYQNIPGQHKNLTDIGFTPVFRFQADDKKGLYAEAGIGVHLMSHLYDNNGRRFSTAFEFGDHLGAGYVFNNGLDLGVRLQHFSNGGIKHPNSGANFAVARAAYHF
ncbi:acyloxyacyl hydrolase [Paraherbaspirillum soli]|uniref:Lipid A deacylase n=1 Tax=Paraherbaspirillum soli TaxID=631222 RepID=A0ABW0MEA6_9BURK